MCFLSFIAVFVSLTSIAIADPIPRIEGGQDVDNLLQFPYHVYILCSSDRMCGGSILNNHWVLTSAVCVKDSSRLTLHFGMKNGYDFGAAYHSISVNSEQVFAYPTNYDDLALIRLPMKLIFSDTIKPVAISGISAEGLRNNLAVLPGFDGKTLKYGMFNIVEADVCEQKLGSDKYVENFQICTEGWGSNRNTPCDSDFGSGLVVGWPAESELVGIFSMYSSSCNEKIPAVYTFVPKYISWINSVIEG